MQYDTPYIICSQFTRPGSKTPFGNQTDFAKYQDSRTAICTTLHLEDNLENSLSQCQICKTINAQMKSGI